MADESMKQRGKGLKWRGLLAGAAAVVAGIAMKQTAQPVAAGSDGDVVLGGLNSTTQETTVRNNGDPAVVGTVAALIGIRSTHIASAGAGNIGVYGVTDLAGAVGVRGT